MSQFRVSTPALGYSAAAMSAALADFDAHVAQVSASVNAVVGASWSGSAADAFAESWSGWLSDAALTRAALADIVLRLQSAGSAYELTEGQIASASRGSAVGTDTKKVGA
jgi:WXG100 family type VII secretion target